MNDEYNEQGLLGGKGFYIALLLCVSIIAVSAWMIFRNQSKDDQADALAEIGIVPGIFDEHTADEHRFRHRALAGAEGLEGLTGLGGEAV